MASEAIIAVGFLLGMPTLYYVVILALRSESEPVRVITGALVITVVVVGIALSFARDAEYASPEYQMDWSN